MAAILLWITSPYMAFITEWQLYAVLWGAWIVLAYLTNNRAFISMLSSKYSFTVFLWPIIVCVLDLVGWANFSPYQFTISFLIISIVYYIKGNYIQSMQFLIVVFLLYVLVINIFSIGVLLIDPNMARTLAQSDKDITGEFASPLMANFAYINSISLLSVAFFTFLKTRPEKWIARIIVFFLLATNIYVLFLAQYTLSILTMVFFSFLVYVTDYKQTLRSTFRLLIATGIVLIIGGPLLLMIAKESDSILFANRARSLGLLLTSGTIESGSDFQERLMLYSKSISTFFHNPLIGVGGAVFEAGGQVGGHSDIFDRFAYYGLFIGSFFLYYLYAAYKNIARFFNSQKHHLYHILFLDFIMVLLFNPGYQEPILFTMFFVAPALLFIAVPEMKELGL